MGAYIDFWESLSSVQQCSLAERDAQLNHLRRLARIMGTTALVQAHNILGSGPINMVH